jgi:hypothetical protein
MPEQQEDRKTTSEGRGVVIASLWLNEGLRNKPLSGYLNPRSLADLLSIITGALFFGGTIRVSVFKNQFARKDTDATHVVTVSYYQRSDGTEEAAGGDDPIFG